MKTPKPMTLRQYANLKRGALSDLARKLNVTLPVVSNWANRKRSVPAARCIAIEIATDGIVLAKTLRPDLPWNHYSTEKGTSS